MAKHNTVTQAEPETQTVDPIAEFTGRYPELLQTHKTVSGVIRFLDKKGLSKGQIAKVTGKRFQHVRNVLITPVANPKV
jgi:hypothetical protein